MRFGEQFLADPARVLQQRSGDEVRRSVRHVGVQERVDTVDDLTLAAGLLRVGERA
ncbi:MAG: hypothetical protein ACRDQF_02665 [Thermocrispum sp.]